MPPRQTVISSSRPGITCLTLAALVLACPAVAMQGLDAATPAGKPAGAQVSVAEALRALQGPSLQFLFSDALLPPGLAALEEAEPGMSPLDKARRLLAPHGLALRQAGAGLYAVIRAPRTASPAVAGASDDGAELGEVVVAASRYRLGQPDAPLSLEALDFAANPGPGEDPVRAAARLPGIVSDGISARPHVRGGDADEVLMLLDGFPLRRAYHLSSYQSLFSVIDSNVVRSMDIYSGGYSARYGNRMAGVFDMHTRDARDAPAHSLGIDFYNASGLTSGTTPLFDGEYIASARLGTLSPLLRAFAPSVGDPRYADAYLRIGNGSGEDFSWSGNFLWARDELRIEDSVSGESADLEDRSRYLWMRADYAPAPEVKLTGMFGNTVIDAHRTGTVDNPGVVMGDVLDDRSSTIWEALGSVEWQWNANSRLDAGAELSFQDSHYEYAARAVFSAPVERLFARPQQLQRQESLSPSRHRISLFASQQFRAAGGITAEIGARAQHVDDDGDASSWRFDPRLAAGWELSSRTSVHAAWGLYHQDDDVYELKVEDGLTRFAPPQRSQHLILGVRHTGASIDWRAEIYSKRQTDPRPRFENLYSRRTILPELAPDRVEVLPDYAEVHGIEFSGQWRLREWQSWMTLGWSEALDETGGVHTRRSWDTAVSGAAGVRWRRGPWHAQAALSLHRGFPTTALESTAAGLSVGPRNGQNYPTFGQLDLLLQHEATVRRGALVYTFELINATNQGNPCCAQVVALPGGLALREQQGLPLFPSFGVRWSW